MPICFLDVPAGIRGDAKQTLVQRFTDALNETFQVADVRIFIREYEAEDAAHDGRLRAEPVRPVCTLNVPPLRNLDAKRKLTGKLQAAIGDAYQGIAGTDGFVIFYNHYPPENAALGGSLFSDMKQPAEVGQ